MSILLVNRWNRENVTEACRQADQERLAEGIMLPLDGPTITALSRRSPDFPSLKPVSEYVGGVTDLQAELGRVTTKVALGWTEEQWRQNAQWLMLIQAEKGLDSISQTDMTQLAAAGLAPNARAITAVWGTLGNYRLRNGIEKRPVYQAAKSWERKEYAENGKAYAEYLGRDFGMPLMPTVDDIQLGAKNDQTPTPGQINKKFQDGGIEEYQSTLGFVNSYTTRHWTDAQWRDNLEWLLEVCSHHGISTSSLSDTLAIAKRLHIGPSVNDVIERWGNLINYGNLVSRETEQRKRHLSNEGILRAAIELVAKKRQPLRYEDMDEHEALGKTIIKRRFGGINPLNLRLGYITGTKNWDSNMLLWWGIAKFYQQEGHYPNTVDIEKWSAEKRGPSLTKVHGVIGPLGPFHSELDNAAHWLEVQVDNLVTTGLPKPFIKLTLLTNHELFTPDQDLDRGVLKLFTDLRQAGIDVNYIGHLMHVGIPFDNSGIHLTTLAEHLRDHNMLRSGVLRQLEPYIRGLAPLDVKDSWSSFVKDHKEATPTLQVA